MVGGISCLLAEEGSSSIIAGPGSHFYRHCRRPSDGFCGIKQFCIPETFYINFTTMSRS